MRTCVGCRAEAAPVALVRFAFDGVRLVPDPRQRLGGRGVWVHPRARCIRAAVRGGGFAKVLRAEVPFDASSLVGTLLDEQRSRMASLLGGGRRARLLSFGTDECASAIARGTASLVVVASDARASRETVTEVAQRAGVRVVEMEDKERLGRCFGKDEVGAVVVTDAGLAREISQVAMRIAALSEGE